MNIKPILIATAVALTSINANAQCLFKGKVYPAGYSVAPYDVAAAAGSVPTGQHATSYTCSLTSVGWPIVTRDEQTVLAGDSYTPDASLCNESTYYNIVCTVASSEYNTFNVSYNNGGGTGSAPSTPTNCTYNGTCNAPANTYTAPAGHIFAGWKCTVSGSNCGTFTPGQSISNATSTNGATITLTAQWLDPVPFKTPTSKSYVDSKMNALQPNFAGLGANKLMTYGTTAGAVGSRDIVTELGTSTTADSIPTKGAIRIGLNTKQQTLKGTAGWVVENTGTAGSVKAKPVYSTTNNYKTALVEADDLNTIITNAVNSELTEVAEGWQINTVGNLTLPTLRTFLDASIDGSNYCYRSLSGSGYNDTTCSAATLSTLGASGNKSGLWGAVMPYGDIVGKSVCSATQGSSNTAATDAQESALTTEFNNQTGVGTSALSSSQKYCWCKMESFAGEPAVSRWVFYNRESWASDCAGACASRCGDNARRSSSLRSGLFNSVE